MFNKDRKIELLVYLFTKQKHLRNSLVILSQTLISYSCILFSVTQTEDMRLPSVALCKFISLW